MSDVEVTVASAGQKGALDNLFQLYVHDFSEHWGGTDDGELADDGRFEPYRHLDSYWSDESCVPLFIRADERLAGFALLNRRSQTGRGVDRNMAEFFIARKHRRSGVGTAAVHAILARYPAGTLLGVHLDADGIVLRVREDNTGEAGDG